MSAAAVQAFYATETDDGEIILLTLTYPGWSEPMRLTNAAEQRLAVPDDIYGNPVYGLVSRGQTFVYLPFEVAFPNDDEEAPRTSIVIDGVTRALTPYIREVSQPIATLLEVVRIKALDDVVAAHADLELTNFSYNVDTVQADLTTDTYTSEAFPAHGYTPSGFAGLF